MHTKRKYRLREFGLRCKAKSIAHLVSPAIHDETDLQILNRKCEPIWYGADDVDRFRSDWLHANILSKFPDFQLDIDREQVALDSFTAAEVACRETNERLIFASGNPDVEPIIMIARRKIEEVLGSFDAVELLERCRFSSGASTRLTRVHASIPQKFSVVKRMHVTRNCFPLMAELIRSVPSWLDLCRSQTSSDNAADWLEIVPGNILTTVPKNAKTNRVIAKEPCGNMYLQLGIGSMIRRRLRKVGVDLNCQVKNQHLAQEGSIDNMLATLDLKAASDSISMELCQLLLPYDWFGACCLTRSSVGVLPSGRLISYQKMSSMGNGFTFELESLLFWSVCAAVREYTRCSDRRLAVYGDDLVVPCSIAAVTVRILNWCGFEVNTDKSFDSGWFRESCGKHYFNGVDVTPFYIRKPVDNVYRLYWAANSFRRWCTRFLGYGEGHDFETWIAVVSMIPKRWRKPICDNRGDGGILMTLAEARPRFKGSCYNGVEVSPMVTQFEPGSYLRYLAWLNSPVSSDKKVSKSGKGEASDDILLSKAIPDAYRIKRFVSVVWEDPCPFIV